jgi:hypothetical protein
MGIATCVVVALSEDVRDIVAAKLKSLGMEATLVASPEELPAVLEKIPACGILLEVITAIKASPDAKKAIQELSEFYPFGKFKRAGNEVLILGKESLQSFVHDCQQFNPRTLRRDTRHSAYLAVHLCADEKFEDAEKVVTVNVSDHGCFVYSIGSGAPAIAYGYGFSAMTRTFVAQFARGNRGATTKPCPASASNSMRR